MLRSSRPRYVSEREPSFSPTRWAMLSTPGRWPHSRRHDLWLIKDCCDVVGTAYRGHRVGTFGDLATTSSIPRTTSAWAKAGGTHRSAAAADNRGIVPRLGPRLLLRARPRQHLRQAFRLAATGPPLRLRSQVQPLPQHRLQPENDRHGGRRGHSATGQAGRIHPGPPAQLSSVARGARRLGGILRAAGGYVRLGAKPVRISTRGASGSALRAAR